MKHGLSLLFLSTLFFFGKAQTFPSYNFDSEDARQKQASYFLEHSKYFLKNLPIQYSGKKKRFVKEQFELIHLDFYYDILGGNMFYNPEVDQMVQNIYDEIRFNNPNVPEIHFYISRNTTPNAYSLGDYNIVINLGLFYYLQSEAQIAAVISHEISHQMLNHQLKIKEKTYDYEHSTTFKKEIRKISKDPENSEGRFFNLYKNKRYTLGKILRQYEYVADSMGYLIYRHTNFPKNEYLKTFEELMVADTSPKYILKEETYFTYFNLPEQKFKEEWLNNTKPLPNEEVDERFISFDSLKVHPETSERIQKLKNNFPELSHEQPEKRDTESYRHIQNMAQHEMLPSLNHRENYGKGVYMTLLFLQEKPQDSYYLYWLGKFFKGLYEAKKLDNLMVHLDVMDEEIHTENYQQFLHFIWNLSESELRKIAEHYEGKEE